MKWLKKVAATPLTTIARVVDSLQLQTNDRTNAPSVHAVNNALNNLNNNLSNDIDNINTHLQTVDAFIGSIGATVYPVGSIYISVNNVDPATLFGGTWERIQDRFLLAAGQTYTAGATGGEATHTLTIDEMPSHAHNITAMPIRTNTGTEINIYEVGGDNVESSTQVVGNDQPHNNMPPYLAVYVWKRIS